MRVAIYARISFDWEGKQLGVSRQREDCDKLADLRGWTVADYYIDNNLSAFKSNVERPEFNRLMADLKAGKVDGIVVYDLDRLTRQPMQLEQLVEIYEARQGLAFATVQNDINLSTSDGLTMARVMIAFASKASMDTSRRQKRKNIQRAEQGLPHGSRRPYGYEADLITIRESEAWMLREMARRIIQGQSCRDVAYWLNEQGVETTTGKPWYPITVRNMLLKPRYAGIRDHQGQQYKAVWPGVFDTDTYVAIKAKLARDINVSSNGRYLLTGLLSCGVCGNSLNGETKRDPRNKRPDGSLGPVKPLRRVYSCRGQGDTTRQGGCRKITRGAEPLEHFIRELVIYRLDTPDLEALLQADVPGIPEGLLQQRDALQDKLSRINDDYVNDRLSAVQATQAEKKVRDALGLVEKQIADSAASTSLAGMLSAGETVRQAWGKNPDGWRRRLLSLLIKRVTVDQGSSKPFYDVDGKRFRFDPSLIRIEWRA